LARCRKFALGERKTFALPKTFTLMPPFGGHYETRGTDVAEGMAAAYSVA
jgi:hypothetical protein